MLIMALNTLAIWSSSSMLTHSCVECIKKVKESIIFVLWPQHLKLSFQISPTQIFVWCTIWYYGQVDFVVCLVDFKRLLWSPDVIIWKSSGRLTCSFSTESDDSKGCNNPRILPPSLDKMRSHWTLTCIFHVPDQRWLQKL